MLSTPFLALVATALAGLSTASELHARNLVYRSPLAELPQLDIDIEQLAKRSAGSKAYTGPLDFRYGVAAGDADEKSAIIWSHPVPAQNVSELCLKYETSTSKTKFDKKSVVDSGEVKTTPDVDYSVKLETKHLKPKTQYYYRFTSCGNSSAVSPVGALKTTPSPNDASFDKATMAVFSCSNFPNGFFGAYNQAEKRNKIDFWLHLGDFIYESYSKAPLAGPERQVMPAREISTLDDYRLRYKTYHTDAGLLALRQNKASYVVWDDHEVADNAWKAGTADSNDTVAGEVNG
mgnify:FL=1|jgi:alkaline phosphatase D